MDVDFDFDDDDMEEPILPIDKKEVLKDFGRWLVKLGNHLQDIDSELVINAELKFEPSFENGSMSVEELLVFGPKDSFYRGGKTTITIEKKSG